MIINNIFSLIPKNTIGVYIIALFIVVNSATVFAAQMQNADPHKPLVDDLVLVPEGKFVMGDNKVEKSNFAGEFGNTKPWYMDEHPEHTVELPAYYIEEHEVTNKQYMDYVVSANVDPPGYWLKQGYIFKAKMDQLISIRLETLQKLGANVFRIDKDTRKMSKEELLKDISDKIAYMDNLPVTYVTWKEASDYCRWAGLRLPSEEEWEKASRGPSGQEFPWGNEFKKHMSNTGAEQWDMGVAPIESYQTDKSPYGIYDLAGNVSEWVADWYQAYPGSDYQSDMFGKKFKVARGAGWSGGTGHYALQLFQRGAYRANLPPDQKFDDVGFRCAADDTPKIHTLVSQSHH